MATKAKKAELVGELEELFAKSQVALLADLSGYTVEEITKLRRKLDKSNARCTIAKNTLIRIASKDTQFSQLSEMAKGPTAVILGFEDPAAAAKAAVDYLKDVKKGSVKGGVLDGNLLSAADIKALADLPPRDQLLAGIAGGLDSGARGVVNILNAVIRDIAILAEEVAKKKEGAA